LDKVPVDIKRSIWLRDDFSCRSCGRTLGWEDLNIGIVGKPDDPDGMIALCGDCVSAKGTIDKRFVRFLDALRNIECPEIDLEEVEDPIAKARIDSLESEIRSLREEGDKRLRVLIAYKNRSEQAESDYRNLKARTEKEIALKVQTSLRGLLLGMISSIDDLDRSLASLEGDAKIGVEAVRRNMVRTLEGTGIEVVDPSDGTFDPRFHEAVDVQYIEGEENRIIAVHSPGYLLDGKVLRAAKVTVARTLGNLEEFEIVEDEEYEVRSARRKDPPVKPRRKRKRSE